MLIHHPVYFRRQASPFQVFTGWSTGASVLSGLLVTGTTVIGGGDVVYQIDPSTPITGVGWVDRLLTVSGMQYAANSGSFYVVGHDDIANTITVDNPSGVNEAGSSGSGELFEAVAQYETQYLYNKGIVFNAVPVPSGRTKIKNILYSIQSTTGLSTTDTLFDYANIHICHSPVNPFGQLFAGITGLSVNVYDRADGTSWPATESTVDNIELIPSPRVIEGEFFPARGNLFLDAAGATYEEYKKINTDLFAIRLGAVYTISLSEAREVLHPYEIEFESPGGYLLTFAGINGENNSGDTQVIKGSVKYELEAAR